MIPFTLVTKNLAKHKLRFVLTVLSLAVAIFLLCVLRSLVVALNAGVADAAANRVIVQSKVSLFVQMPQSYGPKLKLVDGVSSLVRWNWFGGYYQDPSNFFAQFATDPKELFDVYPELYLVDGTKEAFLADRKACLVGAETAAKYGIQVGDSFPIIGALYPTTDGSAWDFQVAGIYRSKKKSLDENTLFFHYDFLEKSLESGAASGPDGVGIFVLKVAPGYQPVEVMSEVDALFENGPQVVQATSESEFQAQFVSMVGNVPLLVSSIGGGVMIAILLAVLNTMLMSAREQTRDIGVLKALGFTDGSVFGILILQAFVLCGLGGALGILLAKMSEPGMARAIGSMFPGYQVTMPTLLEAGGATLAIGFLAGITPALRARALSVIDALRAVR
ncbi:MAG: ABC transporter permease [Planctomycetota bacterium]|nr:ABC transporter permease [Planctomycetota bacterium]